MNAPTSAIVAAAPGKGLRIALWIAQALVALAFCNFGLMKLTQPIAELAKMMAWAAQFPEPMVRALGAVDVAGGLGILLPALLRIAPRLTVWAALGCVALQLCAIVFHVSRGEIALLPLNLVLLSLSRFVLWGRAMKAPIVARG
jgi:uncharacterized membrane protein YphA (DoxX/SURF4 family)